MVLCFCFVVVVIVCFYLNRLLENQILWLPIRSLQREMYSKKIKSAIVSLGYNVLACLNIMHNTMAFLHWRRYKWGFVPPSKPHLHKLRRALWFLLMPEKVVNTYVDLYIYIYIFF